MRKRLEIHTEPPELATTMRNWTYSTRDLASTRDLGNRSPTFRDNSGVITTRYSKTKSHAEIMRISMKTFLTDLKIPYQPQKVYSKEAENDSEKKLRRPKTRFAPEFKQFLDRAQKTVGKLRTLNEKLQKSFVLSNPHSASGIRGSPLNIFSTTSIPLTSSHSRPSTNTKGKRNGNEYGEKDFEDPDGNQSLIEAIRLIDSNKKSDAVAEAMWQDLGEGYKMYDHLVHERKRKEKEMHGLQEYLKSLSMFNSNQHLHDKVAELKEEIKMQERQVDEDEMQYEILQSTLFDRRAQSELLKQRFNKKYVTLPKLDLGLKLGVDEIKRDTIDLENTINDVGAIYANLRSLQRLSKAHEDDLQRQMADNTLAEQNIALEQQFKEQRVEYIKKKKKDEERELNKQETDLLEKINHEINECKEQIAKYSSNVAVIMKETKLSENKEDILKLWKELLDMNQTFKDKVEEAETERRNVEETLKQEALALQMTKTSKVIKADVNNMPELDRKESDLEKAQRDLERERNLFSMNQRTVTSFLAGFSKIFEEIDKNKNQLGVDDLEIIPCTEDNLEKVVGYLSYVVGKIAKNDELKETELKETVQKASKPDSQAFLS